MYYVNITLENANASGYLTLNTSSLSDSCMFAVDTTYTIAAGSTNLIVQNTDVNGWITYNITQTALLTLTWTINNDDDWILTPTFTGTTEYQVTGYDSPVVTTDPNDDHNIDTAFTLTFSSV